MSPAGLSDYNRQPTVLLPRPVFTWHGLAAAVAGPGVATGIGLLAGLEQKPGIGALYLAAVAVAAFAGGFWAGVLASALSLLGYEYFFVGSAHSLDIGSTDAIVAGVLFLACSIVVAQVVERLRAASRSAETALAALAETEERYRSLAREQLAVAELGRRALTGGRPPELFDGAVEAVGEVLGVACAEVLRASADGGELLVVSGIGLPEGTVGSRRLVVSPRTAEGRAYLSREPVVLERSEENELAPYLGGRDVLHELAVPIRGGERLWGVLAVHSSKPRAFSDFDVSFLRGIANVLGAAVLRSEAEDVLRETKDELEALIEASPIPIVAYDPEGRVTLWNHAAERVFGWTPEEAIGRLLPFVQDEMLDEFDFVRERALAGQSFSSFETVRRRKDGTLIDVSFSNAPLRDATGRIRGVVALVSDITDRKRVERIVRDSEEQLRMALDAAEMGIWEWDIQTGVVNWSDRLYPIHGLDPGAFDGSFEQYQTLIHPDDREFVLGAIQAALERGAGYHVEFRVVWPDGTVHWVWGQGRVILDEKGKPARMVGLGRDTTARKQHEEALVFVAEASEALSSRLDYERTLREVARLAVPRLADCCVVDVLDGELHQLVVAHVDPAKEALVRELEERYPADPRLERSVVGSVLRSRKPLVISHVDDQVAKELAHNEEHLEGLRRLRLGSILVVPLVVRGRTIGALTLLAGESGRRFGAEDVAIATDLARHAALAVDNARLYEQRTTIAETLQRSLLPPALPEIPGIELAARYFPAGEGLEVGGDFYDAFQTSDDTWVLVIGDVCGKGTEAAAITGLTRHTLRTAALHEPSPSGQLAVLNDAVLAAHANGTFCTVASARLELRRGGASLTVACGGHPRPIVIDARGDIHEVGSFGSLVGFFDDPDFTDESIELAPGDTVFFYTDGLVERRGGQMAAGEERLKELLRDAAGGSAEQIAGRVEQAVMSEERGDVRDDTAFLVVRVTPGPRPS